MAQSFIFIPSNGRETAPNLAENTCNFAGTLKVEQFIGQSSDTDLSTIYLCYGDSILIRHLGDADLSGDPIPATAPGIVYGFYICSPQVSGETFQDIQTDPCLLPGSANGLFVTQGVQNGGDTWFFNDGSIQNGFNNGKPTQLFFAPITIDDYSSTSYESAQLGAEPGPCVDVNTDAIFEVVYLNEIKAVGINNASSDDCIGRFTLLGGYPQFDQTAIYTVDIELTANPAVKAQVLTPQSNLFANSSVSFSVSAPGIYTVTIEDGKSCGKQFQMDMSGCDASDNLVLQIDEVAGAPGAEVCVPLRVKNFDIASAAFSINWDPELLKFKEIVNINPLITNAFNLDTNITIGLAAIGKFGIIMFNSWNLGAAITVPDGEVLFELCYEVLDTTDQNCIPIIFNNTPSQISMENVLGETLGVTLISGGVCKAVSAEEPTIEFQTQCFPNPLKSGETARLSVYSSKTASFQWTLSDVQGKNILFQNLDLAEGQHELILPTANLVPGVYFASLRDNSGVLRGFKLVVY